MMKDPFATNADAPVRELRISDSAIARMKELLSTEDHGDLMLRVSVSGGGCSGFQYNFSLDDCVSGDDLVFERDGIQIVSDTMSMDFLAGAEVDYVDDLVGAFFQIKNPNATASCGCGTSFAV